MTLVEFETEFLTLGENHKTKNVDKFNRNLIKRNIDVSFLKNVILSKQKYHRTYFQVSLAQLKSLEEKFDFIESNFDKLQDWWHVDQLAQFVSKDLVFDFVYNRAKKYINNNLKFARRWGYIVFMPKLVKDISVSEKLFSLFKNDDEYYVQMAEAWLISYLCVYNPEKTFEYLNQCSLDYNIIGKSIQKICDSFRVCTEWKEKFKEIRNKFK